MPPLEAALAGARADRLHRSSRSRVSLLAVFIPILLMGGIVGRLFREFAVTLSDRHRASRRVVSLTLTPMMCARLLRARARRARTGGSTACVERVFDAAAARLRPRRSRWVLRHRALDRCSSPSRRSALDGLPLRRSCRRASSRSRTPACSSGFSEAPQDISFPAMQRARRRRSTQIVQADPDVDARRRRSSAAAAATGNTGTMFVALKPHAERKATRRRGHRAPAAEAGAGPGHHAVPAGGAGRARRRPRVAHAVPVHAAGRRTSTSCTTWAPRVLDDAAASCPSSRDVATDQQTRGLQLDVDDRSRHRRAPRHHAAAIDDTLYDAFGQRQVATIVHRSSTSTASCWRSTPRARQRPDALRQHLRARADAARWCRCRRSRSSQPATDAARRSTTRGSSRR